MNRKTTIIMVGGKSHSGKGTFSQNLEKLLKQTDKNIIRCSLSTYIRDITKNDFYWNGKDTTEARQFMGEVYRLATELIYPYHMARRVWERDILPNLKDDNIVIIESLREKNNLDYFQQLKEQGLINKIVTIKVIRPDYSDIKESQQKHVSETDLDNYEFDHYIYNDGTIEDLHIKAINLLNDILETHDKIKLETLDDIPLGSIVKVIKINNTEKAEHLTQYIGRKFEVLSWIRPHENEEKRYKCLINPINNETAYFKRSELEIVQSL